MFSPLNRERAYPYVGGLIASGIVMLLSDSGYKLSYSEDMLASLVSLGGIFAGFLATVKTLLLTMNVVVLNRLKESGYLNDLLRYLREGIYGALLLCVIAMVGFNEAMLWPEKHVALLFGALVFSLLALYRITRIAMALLLYINPNDPDESG